MFSGTQIECWPVDYVACSGLSQLSELFPKPQSLQIVLIFASTRQVWKAFAANTHTCSQSILGSRRVFHWVTQSFPQGDPIIFLDHPISPPARGTRQLRPLCHRLMGTPPEAVNP